MKIGIEISFFKGVLHVLTHKKYHPFLLFYIYMVRSFLNGVYAAINITVNMDRYFFSNHRLRYYKSMIVTIMKITYMNWEICMCWFRLFIYPFLFYSKTPVL